jgi:RNase P/RNase MRP subunit p30
MTFPSTDQIDLEESDKEEMEQEISATANECPPPGRRQRVALKKLCSTRWEDHLLALDSLMCSYADVIYCLEYFSTEDHKADVRSRAQSLYKFFSKLECVAILCLEFEKLRILRKCSKTFQNKSIELSEAGELLSTALAEIEKIDLDSV